jgi:hypothetical protein
MAGKRGFDDFVVEIVRLFDDQKVSKFCPVAASSSDLRLDDALATPRP